MGELLQFPLERALREPRATPVPPAFFYDLTNPLCYLAAERVERLLGEVEWVVVDGAELAPSAAPMFHARVRAHAEAQARAWRLPLVWPDPFPMSAPAARRAADFACEIGAGPAFALAATRLAFCGGFALDDPEILAEAAAAAAVPLRPCLEAARDHDRDAPMRDMATALAAAGVTALPAFRIDGQWFDGEESLAAAGDVLIRRELALSGPSAAS